MVARDVPFHLTTDEEMKSVPVAVIVVSPSFRMAEVGEMEVNTGTRFSDRI